MDSWEETLRDLRAGYLRESAAKLEGLAGAVEQLAAHPEDDDLRNDLLRRFHAFAGSGRTYGFPQVSALGLEGETRSADLARHGTAPGPADFDRFRALVEALKTEFGEVGAETTPPRTAPPKPAARTSTILVVDDDDDIREKLAQRVEQEGMSARSVGTLTDARAAIDDRLPDGMITAIGLPDGSGYELVEYLRAQPGGERPAVLVVSALGNFLDKVEAVHCGADGYFEKPVDWEGLMRRLQHLLESDKQEPVRVLSVEDDPQQAALLQAVLESAGYEVRVCDDPKHFETDLIGFAPDLVIMDILLPGVSGYDLVRYLRQDERYATLPILFLTTEREVHARIETARAGGDDHLVKPVSPGLLLSTVAARIERARFVKSLLDRDGLTRLLTHTAFIERARAAVSLKSRNPVRNSAWVMIDLDLFKSINDRYGHPVGDRVLASLAALLRRRLRQSDTIGRYGGEEFAILINDLQEHQVVRLVSRVLAEFAAMDHPAPGDATFRTSFSAGVAMLDPSTMDLDGWRKAADDALYEAKASGRNRVVAARRSAPDGGAHPAPTAARRA
jgi:diguanylate cyclase (GGDEF)-like protein